MSHDPCEALVARLDARGFGPRPTDPGSWLSRCPAHRGSRDNLSIKRGDDGRALLKCHHGGTCDFKSIVAALGMAESELFPPRDNRRRPPETAGPTPPVDRAKPRETSPAARPKRTYPTPDDAIAGTVARLGDRTAHWPYHDADGREVMRVYRFDPPGGKTYRPVHRTDDGSWAMGDPPGKLPLYRLPELAAAPLVVVTEGEKARDAARVLGLVATTSSHGSEAPHRTDWTPLAGKTVVICPDHDEPGERYAKAVVGLLAGLSPRPTVKVVRLPSIWKEVAPIPEGADLVEWRTDGVPDGGFDDELCRAELLRVAEQTPEEDMSEPCRAEPATAEDEPPVRVAEWPAPPDDAAYHGLAGEIVRAIEPHSEADPVAILAQLLIGFGGMIGRSAHFSVEADRHFANEFVALVGDTAKGRKGTSWGHVRRLLKSVDPEWEGGRIAGGLSSGEGLIHAVRDATAKQEPIKEGKRITGYQDVADDPGEPDKRLLCMESELGGTLKVATRDGNTLSALIRQAWDSGDLRTLTRNNPLRATGAHVSIIGHVTRDELVKLLSRVDASNGFANRFLWLAVRRSKSLPFGGLIGDVDLAPLAARLRDAADFARAIGEVRRDHEADRLWAESYDRLSGGRPGLLGAVTSRAEAHTMRLATLYALVDASPVIRADHLRAGLALWDYAERSAAYIFGDSMGDPDADKLLDALRAAPGGMTRTEIRDDVFQRHKAADAVTRTLAALAGAGLIHPRDESTGGRKAQRWFAGALTPAR